MSRTSAAVLNTQTVFPVACYSHNNTIMSIYLTYKELESENSLIRKHCSHTRDIYEFQVVCLSAKREIENLQ